MNYSLTTAMVTLPADFIETDYIGAFKQDTDDNWNPGWAINVNGNATLWEPASGGTLAGEVPTGDGSCPAGTSFIETVDLPNVRARWMFASWSVDTTAVTSDNSKFFYKVERAQDAPFFV